MPLEANIVFESSDLVKTNPTSTIVFWNGNCGEMPTGSFSLPEYCESHANLLRDSYLRWIYDLGVVSSLGCNMIEKLKLYPDFSLWWQSLLNEKCNFGKSPQIDDAIKLLGLINWAKNKELKSISLAGKYPALSECLRGWCEENNIVYDAKLYAGSIICGKIKYWTKLFTSPFKAIFWLIISYYKRRALIGVGIKKWHETVARKMFVGYTDGLLKKDLDAGLYNSPYWGSLPKVLKDNKTPSNWLHIYVPDQSLPAASDAAKAFKKLNESNQGLQNHVFLDSFRSFKVFFKTIRAWFCHMINCLGSSSKMSNISCGSLKLWPLMRKDWVDSTIGASAISSISSLKLFQSAMVGIPKQEQVIYLCEFINWEYSLGQAFRSNNHGQLIGYAHSTIRFWDLRYFFDRNCFAGSEKIPLPDKLAIGGEAAKKELLDAFFPAQVLTEVEALRYLYLNEFKSRIPSKDDKLQDRFRVLICGDYSSEKNNHILGLVEKGFSMHKQCTIVVKAHPNCPIDLDSFNLPEAKLVNLPLKSILPDVDFVITSSVTSAVLDSYFYGVATAVILDERNLNLSPARNIDGVIFVRNANDLSDHLINVKFDEFSLSKAEDYFFLNPRLDMWKNLIGLN